MIIQSPLNDSLRPLRRLSDRFGSLLRQPRRHRPVGCPLRCMGRGRVRSGKPNGKPRLAIGLGQSAHVGGQLVQQCALSRPRRSVDDEGEIHPFSVQHAAKHVAEGVDVGFTPREEGLRTGRPSASPVRGSQIGVKTHPVLRAERTVVNVLRHHSANFLQGR